jgi:site-specific DNA-adenine methylase
MKSLKTPLRYPGGKSRACLKINSYFPTFDNYQEFREPFLGGGSVSLHVTKKYPHLKIWVNDFYEPLFNFWKTLQSDADQLKTNLLQEKTNNNTKEKAKDLFICHRVRLLSFRLTDKPGVSLLLFNYF